MKRLVHLLLSVAFAAVASAAPLVFQGTDGPGKGKHLVFIAGDHEYRSEESLPALARILAKHHGFKCTVLFDIDPATGEIDYAQMEALAKEHQPKVIVAGFSAYSRFIDFPRVRKIADMVGAKVLVDMAHVAGLVAAGLYPNPFPHAHVVTSTTHKTLCGPRGGLILTMGDDPELDKKINFAVFPENQGGPLMHVIAAKAVAFQEALQPEFRGYQERVLANAQAMAVTLVQRAEAIGFDTRQHTRQDRRIFQRRRRALRHVRRHRMAGIAQQRDRAFGPAR